MRVIALLVLIPLLVAADAPVKSVMKATQKNCAAHQETHALVKKTTLADLNKSHDLLPPCEAMLESSQETLKQAKADIRKLQAANEKLRGQVAELNAQKKALNTHIEKMNVYIDKVQATQCPEQTVADQAAEAWDHVDGTAGIIVGFAAGTGMCIGMAYVFNQPDFGG